MHRDAATHPVTAVATAPAFARTAWAVCTNCLLRGATRFGPCVSTADSDTAADVPAVFSSRGVNAELMTDPMFSVSHPTEGAEGTIIDNSPQWVGGWGGGGVLLLGKPQSAATFPLSLARSLEEVLPVAVTSLAPLKTH